ncbi:MAG: ATP-binding protein [Gammaproteobacteria bacterium]|nr:ATP-binding protein [Gammaproteobacteria bacterium]
MFISRDDKSFGDAEEKINKMIDFSIELPTHNAKQREVLWEKLKNNSSFSFSDTINIELLSSKFCLTAGQINDVINTSYNLSYVKEPKAALNEITSNDVYQACRLHSNRRLGTLAQKITPNYQWDDIVLPLEHQQQMDEIRNYVKYRSQVYENWGFSNKLSMGKGLNILFSGPPGTGKTMASEVLASCFGLDLYKIDLSSIVSKYIGETEKNLGKIFYEAETSNAILFFDEADALFGKRSDVKSSHDRNANIEVSYLLQKIEEYEGIVILATNFRRNMDEAFIRRLHFSIDFPFPEEEERIRIWQNIWPNTMPIDSNVDLEALSKYLKVAGGNIRNVALSSAFLAAEERERNPQAKVTMKHIIHAAKREYKKMGQTVRPGQFDELLNE